MTTIDSEELRVLGLTADAFLNGREGDPELGFILLVFPFAESQINQYISNCHREEMVGALREVANRLENGRDKPVPRRGPING